jgi:hypothetical protein
MAPWEDSSNSAVAQVMSSEPTHTAKAVVNCHRTPPYELKKALLGAHLPLQIIAGDYGEGGGPLLASDLIGFSHEAAINFGDDKSCLLKCFQHPKKTHALNPELSVIKGSKIKEIAQRSLGSYQGTIEWWTLPGSSKAYQRLNLRRNLPHQSSPPPPYSQIPAAGDYRHGSRIKDYDLWQRLFTRNRWFIKLQEVRIKAGVCLGQGTLKRELVHVGKEGRFLLQFTGGILWNGPQGILLLLLRYLIRMLARSNL